MKKKLFFIFGAILILSIAGFIIFSGDDDHEVPAKVQEQKQDPINIVPVCEDCRDANGESGGGSRHPSKINAVINEINSA